ncbi:hypothetical protein CS063_12680 [Sporanaerobium hydrogeniformans]|uniref:Uncharacterized protein n=1 Tax=Sporanaerobium hydrogeniformans TaxID=3072179 RepID=A0AC61DBH1_9FIRM|nr:DHHW family protein [Sporanaerobium hydrogeniformans]PHV69996.1 hypothetical protein CS063_12680 [Sporanaerobium hydrogeniformans]
MKNKLSYTVGFLFLLYIFSFFVFQLLGKDKAFSELENRNLSLLPSFSQEKFFSGDFSKDFEKYIADQFPFRNHFISMKAYSERTLQKKDNNGVYIGKDHYFIQNFIKPDMELAKRNATYINDFAKHFNVTLLLAPTSTKILEDKLPPFATPYDEGRYLEDFITLLSGDIKVIPVLETLLAKKNEPIYYKTDHHWTTLGAYYSYRTLAHELGFTPLELNDFDIINASSSFYGSLFSKGNFTFAQPDNLQLFHFKNPPQLEVTYVAENRVTDTLYEYSHLKSKDKYSVFLDNNHPIITIKSSINNGKKLMLIKDSYANCLIPFLTHHYEEIHVLDLRFLNMPLKSYATENGFEDILFLYNIQNFSGEGKLSLLRN